MKRRTSTEAKPHRQTAAAEEGSIADAATVALVEDDYLLRGLLRDLLSSIGVGAEEFGTARELLARLRPDRVNCVVIDVRLPDKSGLELQDELNRADVALPIIFISGYADVRMTVRAMKAGAVDFLAKPFNEQEFLDAVQSAIERDRDRRTRELLVEDIRRHFDSLTAREQEMMAYVVGGRRNKEIAGEMGVTEITVKAHRNQVMKKMAARSVAALIGMGQLLGHESARPESLIRRRTES